MLDDGRHSLAKSRHGRFHVILMNTTYSQRAMRTCAMANTVGELITDNNMGDERTAKPWPSALKWAWLP